MTIRFHSFHSFYLEFHFNFPKADLLQLPLQLLLHCRILVQVLPRHNTRTPLVCQLGHLFLFRLEGPPLLKELHSDLKFPLRFQN